MVIMAMKLRGSSHFFCHFLVQKSSFRWNSAIPTLQESIRAAIEAKSYNRIPDLLIDSKESFQNPNPFSFLSNFSQSYRTQIVDEILQSFIPLKPRSRPQAAYSCLLCYTLQNPNPIPLALAILQRTLRSGCIPVPQIRLLLSTAWLERRQQDQNVPNILTEMQSIDYHPDTGVCNFLILSLCAVDQLAEAVAVLKGMAVAGCIPDLESYGSVIGAVCAARRTTVAAEMVFEMVTRMGLTPRQEMVLKVIAMMRAKKEIWRAVKVIEFLERKGVHVGFDIYELVVEGCLECREFVLAGKVALGMTGKGFIPYIEARQKVVEGLANIGEWKLACALRQRFTELKC